MVYPCDCYDRNEREQQEKETRERLLQKSQIPPRYQQGAGLIITGQSPYESEVIPWLSNLLASASGFKGFGLIGDVGTGKTYYVCAALRELIYQRKRCLFWSAAEFYDSLKAAFANKRSDEYDDLLTMAKGTYIVAFDDLGAEYATEWTATELGKVINYRYNHLLPTIWTSNLKPDELAERIGTRTVDRLREMGPLKCLQGESRRGRTQAQGKRKG